MSQRCVGYLFGGLLLFVVCGCGRMADPFPPERLNPKPVEFKLAQGLVDGIQLTWFAPQEDERGKSLARLDGYRVYRRIVSASGEEPTVGEAPAIEAPAIEAPAIEAPGSSAEVTQVAPRSEPLETAAIMASPADADNDPLFILQTTIPDSTIETLKAKRNEAGKSGKPLRRVSLTEEERTVVYVDKDVTTGLVYVYKIVPYNQSWFEGRFSNLIKVIFKGEQSEVQLVAEETLSEDGVSDEQIVSPPTASSLFTP